MAAAVLVAHRLRLSKPLTVAASNISFPAAIPFILFGSLLLGRFILTGRIDHSLHHSELTRSAIRSYTLEYLTGSIVLAMLTGLSAAALSYILAKTFLYCKGGRS